jgi:hypothetical protein
MPITRTDTNERFVDGQLVESTTVTVDITAQVVELDLHTKARQAYTNNRTYLAIATPTNAQVVAQVRALTRQMNALMRLAVFRDLLTDEVVD